MDIALNRKPASELDCMGFDPRNELGRRLFDGMAPARAAAMARKRGLAPLRLSENYPFEDWRTERRAEVADLIEEADAAGTDPARASLRDFVAEIAPLLAGTSVVALFEPIGFTMCSMRFQREAIAAIEELGLDDRFGIARWRRTRISSCRISASSTGVCGGTGELTDEQDGERVVLDDSDRTGALGQMRCLIAAGYGGPFSFKAQGLRGRADLPALVAESIAYLGRTLSNADDAGDAPRPTLPRSKKRGINDRSQPLRLRRARPR